MTSQSAERIGAAIRKLRLAKGLTLAELSAQSVIPLSTLSRVELGQNALKYDKLVRICRVLDVDLQGLVARQADTTMVATGRRAVTPAGDGAQVGIGGNKGRRAAADLLAKNISPVVIDVTTASLDDHGPLVTLEGEAYVLVLAGEIVFHNPLYAPLTMKTGDGVYFDGRSGHALLARAGPAKALLIAAGEQTFSS